MNPKIVKIEKKKTKYNVVVSYNLEYYNFPISEDLLIESKFLSLKEITKEEFDIFLSKIPYDSILLEAMNYISKTIKSKKEIIDHLYTKTSSKELIYRCVNELENNGLINDEEYFKAIVNYHIYDKKDGKGKIFEKLNELGLDGYYFEYSENQIKDNIHELTIKYNRKIDGVPLNKKIEKVKMYLLGKGYSLSEIDRYFKISDLSVEDENSLILKDYQKLKERYDDKEKIKVSLIRKGYKKETVEKYVR